MHLLVRLASERGMTMDAVLAGSGVAAETLADPRCEVTARQEFQIMRNLLQHCGDEPGLGAVAGREYHITTYGAWGLALISSPTLRDTIEIALRYVDLAFAFTQLRFEEADGEARLYIEDGAIPAEIRVFLVERTMSGLETIGQDLFASGIPVIRVTFRHPAPADTSVYREVFGVEPVFGAEVNSAVFDAALLDLPLPQANEWALRAYDELCRELLQHRRARTGVAGTVRDLLARHSGAIPDQATVAAELHLSPRTLFRRLAEEGTSFRALVDEVRETLAEELLCTAGMTTEQVSARLGYSEPACFVRAFKRWKGIAPQAFRATTSTPVAVHL